MMIPPDVAEILPRKTAQHVAKDFDGHGDLPVVQMAVSHDKAARRRRFGVVRGERRQAQPATLPPTRQRAVVAASRERGRDVQAGSGALELEKAADSLAKEIGKRAAPFAVNTSHPPDVASEVTLLEKIGERGLIEPRRTEAGDQRLLAECVDNRRWNDDVSEPQRRKEDLAEGADVDHASGTIETAERGQRRSLVAKLAVVIVLENPSISFFRPLQQLQPA